MGPIPAPKNANENAFAPEGQKEWWGGGGERVGESRREEGGEREVGRREGRKVGERGREREKEGGRVENGCKS